MENRPSCPFTWLDGALLALFLALALGAAIADDGWFLGTMMFFGSRESAWPGLPAWASHLEMSAKRVQSDFSAFLAVMSLGIGLVTFRRSPGRRRALLMPGVSATAATCAVLTAQIISALALLTYRKLWSQLTLAGFVELLHGPEFQVSTAGTAVTGAILGTWSYLALARAWRARDDWRDWLGRWLGWAWLSTIAFHALFPMIWG